MRVAILTDLGDVPDSYSVAHVVADQAHMLERAGVDFRVFIRKTSEWEVPKTSAVLASVPLHHYDLNEKPQPEFKDQVDVMLRGNSTGIGYRQALTGFDTVITHDLMACPWHIPHNGALRFTYRDNPKRRYFHWCHSMVRPVSREELCSPSMWRFRARTNGSVTYVFPSSYAAALGAEAISGATTTTVYNPRDIRDLLRFSAETREFIDVTEFLCHDVCQVYGFDTIRWRSKGVAAVLKVLGKIRKAGKRVKLFLANAGAGSEVAQADVANMKKLAAEWHLRPMEDVFWASDVPGWERRTPHRILCELMAASNLFLFPSEEECCSLVQGEAAVTGKLLVLNKGFSPLMEFVDEWTMAYDFSAHSPEKDDFFYEQVARNLVHEIDNDRVFRSTTRARTQTYNKDWIWKEQLQPLLEGDDNANM